MTYALPKDALEADQKIHRLLKSVSFSRHLNPTNVQQAHRAFNSGSSIPPFEYIPLEKPDEILTFLTEAKPKSNHPASKLINEKINSIELLTLALRDRTKDAFDRLATQQNWFPTPALLNLRFDEKSHDYSPMDQPAKTLIQQLRKALAERGLHSWKVEEDTVMSARVLVDGAKHLLRVNPYSRFRASDIQRLIVHEIDVHAMRSFNGASQPLRLFQTGLPNSLQTEEGLAMVAEQKAKVQSPGTLMRQTEVVFAIDLARKAGFFDLYQTLKERIGPALAWSICLRVKRGLKNPEQPGVYAKDSVYLAGWQNVSNWLKQGNDISLLYVGEVGLHHPVQQWIEQGWVRKAKVPQLWYE